MLVCVILAVALRLVLIFFNWPFTDSDEGNMGLLALHVAFQGDYPAFFYGASYMGPIEGYLAAPLFYFFGSSLFLLRLPLVFFFAVFLLAMYYLLLLLYRDRKFALTMVVLLGLGSPDVLFLQLRASGEYPEIEMFAALMCLLALWLALSAARGEQAIRWKRLAISILLGLIIGVALWVDLLIAPFVIAVGVLLVWFCWRELVRWPGLGLLGGMITGAFPLLYYNVTAPWSQNSWFVFLNLEAFERARMLTAHLTWVSQLSGTFLVSLPMATSGAIDCPLTAMPPTGSPSLNTLPCLLFQGGWSVLYLVLWFLAVFLAGYALWKYVGRKRIEKEADLSLEEQQERIRLVGRLGLLFSAGLTLVLYLRSPSSAAAPANAFRYLTCLLLVFPVLLRPLWQGLRKRKNTVNWWVKAVLLLVVMLTLAGGMVKTLGQIPSARVNEQKNEEVVSGLLKLGASRIYSDYWTCNLLIFQDHL